MNDVHMLVALFSCHTVHILYRPNGGVLDLSIKMMFKWHAYLIGFCDMTGTYSILNLTHLVTLTQRQVTLWKKVQL